MCNAYALASDHPIEGDNHHAGGDCYYFFHVRNLPYRRLYVNWHLELFCYLIFLHAEIIHIRSHMS
jgi:hypothetical protein